MMNNSLNQTQDAVHALLPVERTQTFDENLGFKPATFGGVTFTERITGEQCSYIFDLDSVNVSKTKIAINGISRNALLIESNGNRIQIIFKSVLPIYRKLDNAIVVESQSYAGEDPKSHLEFRVESLAAYGNPEHLLDPDSEPLLPSKPDDATMNRFNYINSIYSPLRQALNISSDADLAAYIRKLSGSQDERELINIAALSCAHFIKNHDLELEDELLFPRIQNAFASTPNFNIDIFKVYYKREINKIEESKIQVGSLRKSIEKIRNRLKDANYEDIKAVTFADFLKQKIRSAGNAAPAAVKEGYKQAVNLDSAWVVRYVNSILSDLLKELGSKNAGFIINEDELANLLSSCNKYGMFSNTPILLPVFRELMKVLVCDGRVFTFNAVPEDEYDKYEPRLVVVDKAFNKVFAIEA